MTDRHRSGFLFSKRYSCDTIRGEGDERHFDCVSSSHSLDVALRDKSEFVSKVEVGLQEMEETIYWLELLAESGIVPKKRLAQLHDEADQLAAILVTCVKTAKKRRGK